MTAFMGDSVASPLVWAITIVVTVGLLVVDLAVIARRPHEPSTAEVSRHLAFYIGLAVALRARRLALRRAARALAHPGRSSSPAG